jgi:hypothetical protein
MRVAGVAVGSFGMVDGRPADTAATVAEIVANFRNGTVPLLTRHGGIPVGYLSTLEAGGPLRRDLAFTGEVLDDEELGAVLRRGCPVSVEYGEGLPARSDGGRWSGQPRHSPYFVGRYRLGMNLVVIAILWNGEQPAARGSVVWSVE